MHRRHRPSSQARERWPFADPSPPMGGLRRAYFSRQSRSIRPTPRRFSPAAPSARRSRRGFLRAPIDDLSVFQPKPSPPPPAYRSEEHTSELQSRFGISDAVFFLK